MLMCCGVKGKQLFGARQKGGVTIIVLHDLLFLQIAADCGDHAADFVGRTLMCFSMHQWSDA